jgi:D-3-phosphoglycerate dehydrogenase
MKVLVIDQFPEAHLAELRRLGLGVDYRPQLKPEELAGAVAEGGATILIARGKEVRKDAVEASHSLALIIRAGAGVNTIDVKTASERGVYVANCPGKNAIAVAELTMGLLLALDRRIPDAVADLRAGAWNKKEYGKADGLFGRTIGVVGLGSIGIEVARRARAFGMKVAAWSRSLTDENAFEMEVARMKTVPELCAASDVVSVHVALTAETRGLIGEAALGRMRPKSIFINTSRAEVVDGMALRRAIGEKGLRVALDVFDKEPSGGSGAFEDDVVKLPGVYGTHHVGASTEQAQSAVADETVRIVQAFVERGEVPNCVNLAKKSPAAFQLVVRHFDKVGVLAEVLGAIRRHQINVEEMDNTIFDGAQAASAKIRLATRPPVELLDEIRARSSEVIHVEVVEL